MVLSDVAAHIDAALVVRSSEPRGLATRLPGEYIGWTSVVCHSVNSAHGPTTATLNETNVAGVGGGDARRARAAATTHQSLRAHGIRAPSGAGRGGAVGRAWGCRVLGQLVTAQRNCAGRRRSQRAAPAAGPCRDAPARVAVTYAPMGSFFLADSFFF